MLDFIISVEITMAEKILIIDDDIDTLKLVGLMLQKQGYTIVAASNGPQGLEQAERENPDLILLDVMMPEMDGYEVTKRLRANPLTTNTPILMFTAKTQLDDKVTGFEAGADDYLTKPTHPSELHAHVKALLARTSKGKLSTTPLPTDIPALTIGVLAPRGGQGVSTVAVNLGHALRMATKADVIVAELRPGMGSIGPDMGDPNPKALTDLLTGNVGEMTRQKVKEDLYVHETGLRLLFGSTQPKDASLVNSLAPMEALVNRLTFLTPYLILDLGAGLTPLVQKMISFCNLVFVLAEPVPNAVSHSKMLMDDIADLGISRQCIKVVVVNRIRSDTQINMSQLEELLGQAPVVAITPAPELMYMSARGKTTAIAARPDSLTAQQFNKLATVVLDFEKQK
jgi:CheY-like chemotaxis protein/MinD-like ATPase involved in chromosome partitioning or flagellar assembly